LLEGSGLFGGVKVVLAQAELLSARGHDVSIVSREPAPDWYPLQTRFVHADPLTNVDLPTPDVTVATFWTTIEPALRVANATLHYCQGYEGLHTHNRADHPAIERAYAHHLPAMVVTSALGGLLRERFGRPSRLVPPTLEDFWRPSSASSPARPPRILVVGPFEVDLKGVETALRAVLRLRSSAIECVLVRLSQWPPSEAENALLPADEFHHHVPPRQAAAIFRSADILLAPSREPEGFGLPALEAMASGVPVVASDVSCFRDFAAQAAVLVPPGDDVAFAEAARELLTDRQRWLQYRADGLATAARYTAERRAAGVEDALHWAAGDAWRAELSEIEA
jgi:glycosyltransferase involved in cell wall biosynthesis